MAFFSAGFRTFFFSAALFAGIAVFLWLFLYIDNSADLFPNKLNPLAWHVHEMLFGYLSAVIAGFLLTAIPNWTGQPGLCENKILSLFIIWCLGRICMFFLWPSVLAVFIDSLFLIILAAYAWVAIILAGLKRNIIICILITLLALSNIFFHGQYYFAESYGLGQRAAVAIILVLMSIIGGRVIPVFTTNWLEKKNVKSLPVVQGKLDIFCIIFTVISLSLWVVKPWSLYTGMFLVINGLSHIYRMSRWRFTATLTEALLWILHVAYFWLAIAILLLGCQILFPDLFPGNMAIHAVTSGAAAVFPIAIMTRATLGHSGCQLTADSITVLIYFLVMAGALIRVLAVYVSGNYTLLIFISGILWASGFLVFCIHYSEYFFKSDTAN